MRYVDLPSALQTRRVVSIDALRGTLYPIA
jgi:hypothetical protein